MISCIKKEISLRKDELRNKNLKSLYFGGGTPSILGAENLNSIIDEVLKYFSFENEIEITLEANPDDLDKSFLRELSNSPVNRISIGTQSFYEEDLRMMNRAHNASQAEDSIKRAQDFGFENLSIDLIYGSPTSNFEIWKRNLQKSVDLQVAHISSYALTVEPKTALENWISKGKIQSPNETEQNEEFYFMSQFLKDNGFIHYEISNFGKSGFFSKHNSSYWKCQEYLGVGPSAHSYDGNLKRSWNIANNAEYIKTLNENKLPLESENLSPKDQYNEMIMIGLRTIWGINLDNFESQFSEEIRSHFRREIQSKLGEGILQIENNYLKIPEKHWFLADGIASDLFMV